MKYLGGRDRYGRGHVEEYSDGSITLKSYGTLVVELNIFSGKYQEFERAHCSNTTCQHTSKFESEYCRDYTRVHAPYSFNFQNIDEILEYIKTDFWKDYWNKDCRLSYLSQLNVSTYYSECFQSRYREFLRTYLTVDSNEPRFIKKKGFERLENAIKKNEAHVDVLKQYDNGVVRIELNDILPENITIRLERYNPEEVARRIKIINDHHEAIWNACLTSLARIDKQVQLMNKVVASIDNQIQTRFDGEGLIVWKDSNIKRDRPHGGYVELHQTKELKDLCQRLSSEVKTVL